MSPSVASIVKVFPGLQFITSFEIKGSGWNQLGPQRGSRFDDPQNTVTRPVNGLLRSDLSNFTLNIGTSAETDTGVVQDANRTRQQPSPYKRNRLVRCGIIVLSRSVIPIGLHVMTGSLTNGKKTLDGLVCESVPLS